MFQHILFSVKICIGAMLCKVCFPMTLLDQGVANLLTSGPQLVLRFDRGAGARAGVDGWSVLVTHLIGLKEYEVMWILHSLLSIRKPSQKNLS